MHIAHTVHVLRTNRDFYVSASLLRVVCILMPKSEVLLPLECMRLSNCFSGDSNWRSTPKVQAGGIESRWPTDDQYLYKSGKTRLNTDESFAKLYTRQKCAQGVARDQ